jgi:hypothetical protein
LLIANFPAMTSDDGDLGDLGDLGDAAMLPGL